MPAIPTTNLITADGDHFQSKARSHGRNVSIEVSGTFGGATVTTGYMSADGVPVFIEDVGDDGETRPKTAAGRWVSVAPVSGLLGIRVTGASGATSLLVRFNEVLPR